MVTACHVTLNMSSSAAESGSLSDLRSFLYQNEWTGNLPLLQPSQMDGDADGTNQFHIGLFHHSLAEVKE